LTAADRPNQLFMSEGAAAKRSFPVMIGLLSLVSDIMTRQGLSV
jgi:hypothetical protein